MLVGGYAVAFHGYPRFTKDLDVLYRSSAENIERLKAALVEFGFPPPEVAALAFNQEGEIIRFGVEPVQIDLLNHVDGISFEEAAPSVVHALYGNAPAVFVGKQLLIKNKLATPRLKDKADAEELGQL
jgi:hypothetical protein